MSRLIEQAASILQRAAKANLPRVAGLLLLAAAVSLPASAAVEVRLVDSANSGMSVVEVKGGVDPGDAGRLEQFIKQLPPGRPVAVNLNSPGGNIAEALLMGRFFHANNIATYVRGSGSRCLSACALAFLGGRDAQGVNFRVKGSQASLGYHSFRRVEADREYTVQDMQRATARAQDVLLSITDYLIAVEADIEFMSMMLEAPSEGMNYLENDKALTIGVHVLDERTGRLTRPAASTAAGVRTR
jgi:hypothetical protein